MGNYAAPAAFAVLIGAGWLLHVWIGGWWLPIAIAIGVAIIIGGAILWYQKRTQIREAVVQIRKTRSER